jgi:hypothetical protein
VSDRPFNHWSEVDSLFPQIINESGKLLLTAYYSANVGKSLQYVSLHERRVLAEKDLNCILCTAAYNASCYHFKIFTSSIFRSQACLSPAAHLIIDDSISLVEGQRMGTL